MPAPTTDGASRVAGYPCDCLGWEEIVALSGGVLSYRKLYYWTANLGLLTATYHRPGNGRHMTINDASRRGRPIGSGYALGWTATEAALAIRAGRILHTIAARMGPSFVGSPVAFAFALAEGPLIHPLPDGHKLTITATDEPVIP